MKATISCLLVVTMLGGCGIEGAIKRNDDRYMQPGALDLPLTNIYDTYQYKFLDRYRVAHDWLRASKGCEYKGFPTLNVKDGSRGEIYAIRDIYEDGSSTKQRGAHPAWNFDRYVRSVKYMAPVYPPTTKEESEASIKEVLERARRASKTGRYESPPPSTRTPIRYDETEVGWNALCGETWQVTSHFLTVFLHKRDLASWRAIWTERNPKGKWSERRVGSNLWLVQETAEQDFRPRPLNGVGGPFQTWLLPIGDTGYTLALELGASKETLQYPDAHVRFQATFRHLIESVKIEPLQP